jgi:hypothetical protein
MRAGTVRENLRRTAESVTDDLSAFFIEAVKADRSVSTKCSHCSRSVTVAVADWSARTRAVEVLLAQGYGKPTESNKTLHSDLHGLASRFATDLQDLSMDDLLLIVAEQAIRDGQHDKHLREIL